MRHYINLGLCNLPIFKLVYKAKRSATCRLFLCFVLYNVCVCLCFTIYFFIFLFIYKMQAYIAQKRKEMIIKLR